MPQKELDLTPTHLRKRGRAEHRFDGDRAVPTSLLQPLGAVGKVISDELLRAGQYDRSRALRLACGDVNRQQELIAVASPLGGKAP